MHGLVIVLVVITVIVAVIVRQFLGEPLRGRRVVLLPAILIVIGTVNISEVTSLKASDVVCLVASGVVAAAIGLRQGVLMDLESRNGGLWGRMPTRGLWWWAALIASRLVVFIVAGAIGAKAATSTDSIVLILGLNRLTQAIVIAARAMAAGVPFTPERDGKTFLTGMLGQGSPMRPTAPTDTSTADSVPPASSTASTGPANLKGLDLSDIARRVVERFRQSS